MVGYSKTNEKLNQFDFALAGGGSGFITRAFCQPLDVIKIRFQLQVEPISYKSTSKYRSFLQAVSLILHEEGVKAFWKGHVPAQWLSIVYGIGQFWTFEVLTKEASKLNFRSDMSLVNFTCGSVAGCTATLVSFPFDVVRTRLVGQSEQRKIYTGVLNSLKNIYFKEGPLVLFRGLWPTLVQIGPHAGVQFMTYKLFDEWYRKMFTNNHETTMSSSLVAGSLAGLCSKTAIYPFDLAKKRMQIQGFEEGRKSFGNFFHCRGLSDCLVKIYQLEGFPGYFKGLYPSLIKAVAATALHFSTYEMICHSLIKIKQ